MTLLVLFLNKFLHILARWKVVEYDLIIFNLRLLKKPFNFYGFEIE
jgi:hypothetical protein